MARHINPNNLKNLALDAFVECYGNVLVKTFTKEGNLFERVIEETCHLIHCKKDVLRRCLYVVESRLEELKKSRVRNHLTLFYEKFQPIFQRLIFIVSQEIRSERRMVLVARPMEQVSNKREEQNDILEICKKLYDVLKSALNLIHDQECESVDSNPDHPNESECHLNPDCKLVIEICNTLETVMNSFSDIPSKLNQSRGIYEDLHYILRKTIPPTLANNLTEKLLEYIENTFTKDYEPCYSTSLFEYQWTLFSNLVRAAIHPAVKILDFAKYDNLTCIISEDMSSFSNIVVLKLRMSYKFDRPVISGHYFGNCSNITDFNQKIASGLETMKNLQIFHCCFCDNSVLAALAQNCKHLRCLNVEDSLNLNDDSIKSFEELRYLEEVNIVDTDIKEGLTHMINGMDQNEVTACGEKSTKSALLLKSLGCYCTSDSQISLIVSKLRNIRELKIVVPGYDFIEPSNFLCIKNLQYLKSLSLELSEILDLSEIFEVKGRELLQLELRHVSDVDIRVISANCPALTHLSLEYCLVNSDPAELANISFPALEELCFYGISLILSFPSFVMCGCPKLRVAKYDCNLDDIGTVLNTNPLQYLEEMSVTTSGNLPIEHLRQLTEQCTKLNKLTYSFRIEEDESVLEQFIRELRVKYVALEVTFISNPYL